jgi:hypothetical protein
MSASPPNALAMFSNRLGAWRFLFPALNAAQIRRGDAGCSAAARSPQPANVEALWSV